MDYDMYMRNYCQRSTCPLPPPPPQKKKGKKKKKKKKSLFDRVKPGLSNKSWDFNNHNLKQPWGNQVFQTRAGILTITILNSPEESIYENIVRKNKH